jgi:hypothetical protein
MPHRCYPNVCGPGQTLLAFIRSTICLKANSTSSVRLQSSATRSKSEANDANRLIGPSIFIPFSQPWAFIGRLKIAVKALSVLRPRSPVRSCRSNHACIARGRFHAFHVAVHLGKVLSQRELEETEIALVNWENYIVVQPLTSIPSDFAHSLETSGCNHSFLFP